MARSQHEDEKDAGGVTSLTGRFQSIGAKVAEEFVRPTFAAGAVLWRHHPDSDAHPGEFQFAVIHRPHYDDCSLAKGKLDPGENLPMCAVREIEEETGYQVTLGRLLGHVTYPVGKRTKVVYYWLAEVTGGEFVPNREVDVIEWVDAQSARSLLSYDLDRDVLAKALKRLQVPVTSQMILVRHARAHSRQSWAGNDNVRPLDKKGRRQAEFLGPMLQGFGPTAVYSAEPDRCQQTAAPIAHHLGFSVVVDAMLGDEAWIGQMAAAKKRFTELIAAGGCPVVVSQGVTIPDVVAWFGAEGRLPLDQFDTKKAGVWVLSFDHDELVGADYLASPLPLK